MKPNDEGRVEAGSDEHSGHPAPAGRGRREHRPEGPGPAAGGRRGGAGRFRAGEGRGSGRAQRGGIRAASLLLLADEPMHGYQLMQAVAARTGGAWRPSPGAIYPTIAQLADEGLVTITPEFGRKLVTLTEAGHEHLAANATTMADPFAALMQQAGRRHDLRGGVEKVRDAARAVGHSGSDAQVAAAQQILDHARRALYLLLAEDAQPDAQPGDGMTTSEETS